MTSSFRGLSLLTTTDDLRFAYPTAWLCMLALMIPNPIDLEHGGVACFSGYYFFELLFWLALQFCSPIDLETHTQSFTATIKPLALTRYDSYSVLFACSVPHCQVLPHVHRMSLNVT